MAQEMLASHRFSPPVNRLVTEEWGPFLLGNTAPDVQTVNGHARDTTHFYTIPPSGNVAAYQTLLTAHPGLAQIERLSRGHAVFVAGYLAHLLADEAWWHTIFHPVFGVGAEWATWRERIFLHNVLRTHLDRADQARLDEGVDQVLAEVEPRSWLPFAVDGALCNWRDRLAEQLTPGHRIHTAEVFAARMDIPAAQIEEALASPHQMGRIFEHLPRERLQAYRDSVLRESVDLINDYLGGYK
jgi:hypothetical protein